MVPLPDVTDDLGRLNLRAGQTADDGVQQLCFRVLQTQAVLGAWFSVGEGEGLARNSREVGVELLAQLLRIGVRSRVLGVCGKDMF